jgi:hypothetical protein
MSFYSINLFDSIRDSGFFLRFFSSRKYWQSFKLLCFDNLSLQEGTKRNEWVRPTLRTSVTCFIQWHQVFESLPLPATIFSISCKNIHESSKLQKATAEKVLKAIKVYDSRLLKSSPFTKCRFQSHPWVTVRESVINSRFDKSRT